LQIFRKRKNKKEKRHRVFSLFCCRQQAGNRIRNLHPEMSIRILDVSFPASTRPEAKVRRR
jgi:hypothetical protein